MKQILFVSSTHMNLVGSSVGLMSMLSYCVEQCDFWETICWFQA